MNSENYKIKGSYSFDSLEKRILTGNFDIDKDGFIKGSTIEMGNKIYRRNLKGSIRKIGENISLILLMDEPSNNLVNLECILYRNYETSGFSGIYKGTLRIKNPPLGEEKKTYMELMLLKDFKLNSWLEHILKK